MGRQVDLDEVLEFVASFQGPGTLVHGLRRRFMPVGEQASIASILRQAGLSHLGVGQNWRVRVKGGRLESNITIMEIMAFARQPTIVIRDYPKQEGDTRERFIDDLEFLELLKE